MKRSNCFIPILFGMMILFGLVGSVQAATAADITWWHKTLTQTERNSLILKYAKLDLNLPSVVDVKNRCNCKEWARDVVKAASKSVMTLPPTSSDKWHWEVAPYIYAYSPYNVNAIERSKPGQLIQMLVYDSNGSFVTEHTAIVYGHHSDKMGLWLVDANWKTCKITKHYVTYEDFYVKHKRKFTIYHVE